MADFPRRLLVVVYTLGILARVGSGRSIKAHHRLDQLPGMITRPVCRTVFSVSANFDEMTADGQSIGCEFRVGGRVDRFHFLLGNMTVSQYRLCRTLLEFMFS